MAIALVAIALIATAGAFGLIEPTETRYAEIARAMRTSGDYLVPRLNGIPHFHKPPLPYWGIAAGFALFGTNEWGARVPVVLASVLMLALIPVIARRRFGTLGASPGLAVWALGSSLFFFAIARSAASDPFLSAAVAGFWALAPSPWALVALGAGFMAKGPVVFVTTLLPILIAAAWARDRSPLRLLGPRAGWIGFALVALPWYLIVVARTPGLLDYFLGNQLWGRFATTVHQRGGPPGYFVAVLVIGMIPWTPAFFAGLARLWRERAGVEAKLLLAALLVPLAFFSCSHSKLPAYVLPCAFVWAIIAALGLGNAGRWVRGAGALLLAGVAIAGWVLGPGLLARAVGVPGLELGLPIPAHIGLALLAYGATFLLRSRPERAAACTLLGMTALLTAAAPYEGRLGSPRPLVRVLREHRGAGEPVIEFGEFNAGLPFYLGERVPMLEVPRETRFVGPGAAKAILSRSDVTALAAQHERVWILGSRPASEQLARDLGLRYQGLAAWRKRTLGFLAKTSP